MSKKVIKYFFELIYIFILPLVFMASTSEITIQREFEVVNSDNLPTNETKSISFDNSIIKYTNGYINKLYYNQLLTYNIFVLTENRIINNYDCQLILNNDNKTQYTVYSSSYRLEIDHYYYIYFNFDTSNQFYFYLNGSAITDNYNNIVKITNNNNDFVIRKNTNDIISGNLTFKLIDLTVMYGNDYIPQLNDLLNIINDYIENPLLKQNLEINVIDNNIISSSNKINYTVWGNIKYSFETGLDLNSDSLVLDMVFCYIILWFIMFLTWHIIYLLFDKLFHLRKE